MFKAQFLMRATNLFVTPNSSNVFKNKILM
jgi:hypothetical protein